MTATYIGIRAAARILNVHENTIRNWLNRGVFRDVWHMPNANMRRIARADVERVLAERVKMTDG